MNSNAQLKAASEWARGILDGDVDLIVAIRNIVAIGYDFPKIVEFRPFVGFHSQTDGVQRDPNIRARYGVALLQRLDAEAEAFLEAHKHDIESFCRDLIKAIQSKKP